MIWVPVDFYRRYAVLALTGHGLMGACQSLPTLRCLGPNGLWTILNDATDIVL
ncbi:hypothetical protein GGR92_002922 [Spirosoma lacussanchae]|uniref:hypothetical protein n=1 Tax=Spirosoma lacussanchae TaxID=1884249 RepID=UPI001486D6AF|nr:hypothetical protein [Spirosoma lacussanchae]